jgi:flavin-dependent dehydrogenase
MTSAPPKEYDAIVVGAGVAGLSCAAALRQHGLERVLVLEASHHLGGRVRTVRESELAGDGWPSSHNPWLRLHKPARAVEAPLGAHNFGFEVGAEFVHGPDTVLGELLQKEVGGPCFVLPIAKRLSFFFLAGRAWLYVGCQASCLPDI